MKNGDEECIKTVIEYSVNTEAPNLISVVFPYIQESPQMALIINSTLQDCDESEIKEALLKQDENHCTILHNACLYGQDETVSALLEALAKCTDSDVKEVLLLKNENNHTALDCAIEQQLTAAILFISLLAAKDKDTYTELKLFSHIRGKSDRNPFADVDSKTWRFVLRFYLNEMKAAEKKIDEFERAIKKLEKRVDNDSEKSQKRRLLAEEKDKLKRYTLQLKYLPLIAAEKNRFGESSYHYETLVPFHTELLDICKKYHIDESGTVSLAEMFPSFYTHQKEKVPCNETLSLHPLSVMVESGHLALIKHPYVMTYVDACWFSLGGTVLWNHINMYVLYLFFLITFFSTYQFQSNGSDLEFESQVPVLTEICRYGAIVLAVCGLVFEVWQLKTKMWHYLKQIENYIDVTLFVFTIIVLIISRAIGHNKVIHWLGSFMVLTAALNGAWLFTNIPYVGNRFRMLFSVFGQVLVFSPILIFFIVIFSVVFHILLHNQQPFSHIGFSIVKIMAMTIGELEFSDMFFDETNVNAFEIVAFLIFVLFLAMMTISMMNLLIGIAVPDVNELLQQGYQNDFKAKVDLILQYSYMFSGINRGKHKKTLSEIYEKRRFWDNTLSEMLKWEKSSQDNAAPDTSNAIAEKIDKMLEQNAILVKENKEIKEKIDVLAKQNEEIDEKIGRISMIRMVDTVKQ